MTGPGQHHSRTFGRIRSRTVADRNWKLLYRFETIMGAICAVCMECLGEGGNQQFRGAYNPNLRTGLLQDAQQGFYQPPNDPYGATAGRQSFPGQMQQGQMQQMGVPNQAGFPQNQQFGGGIGGQSRYGLRPQTMGGMNNMRMGGLPEMGQQNPMMGGQMGNMYNFQQQQQQARNSGSGSGVGGLGPQHDYYTDGYGVSTAQQQQPQQPEKETRGKRADSILFDANPPKRFSYSDDYEY